MIERVVNDKPLNCRPLERMRKRKRDWAIMTCQRTINYFVLAFYLISFSASFSKLNAKFLRAIGLSH